MQFVEFIRISVNNLRSNRMRSVLTIVGISIGIASIVFLVSLGYGLQELSIKKIASIEAISTLDIAPGKNTNQNVNDEFLAKLKDMAEISKISPLLAAGTKIEFEGRQTEAVGNFIDDNYAALDGINPVLGAFFSNSDSNFVASTALLKALNIDSQNAIGKKLSAKIILINPDSKEKKTLEKNFSLIGIVQDDATAFSYMPMASIKDSITWSSTYNSAKVKVEDKTKISETKQRVTSMGYSVTSIADTINEVDQIFRIIQLVLAFFGFVALMVASIGMFNTMTIALLERTRDIGIMKAIGVKDRDVSKIFLAESALIATTGGFLGVLIGWLTAKLINYFINLLAISVGGEPQKLFSMPILFSLGIIGFSILVGIATGFYPSKRASKLNPLDALRYE